ncbi:C40 family peptidase [Dyadobacter fanqingshengii]|uniref:NlpC/P60 family protein n=1 Tax=Dyadobacter fanqingshengii TaxID=2906443 RepID=A0A9X1TC65_9BACT|nr:C40 family peptidase [Dyadobacter fanqingshengii]MCF0043155.1 NlpC/P60 family protein [Dyadobacter fanqingshengii]MCF0043233.1 NlpC/P60 family protein [Dyadobacter fanqingshengii]MCF2506751.1 NlpC/P60 family protein [Dyadobacter fanqingshengii]USJ35708.1 NlpC/P60 family protein [Dyadobacter fanqingshengii]
MKNHITRCFQFTICTLALTILLSACDTLRKTPERSKSSRYAPSRSSKSRGAVARRPPARTPARKPATASKPTYSRPGDLPASAVPQVVQVARTYAGTPYRSGGNDKNGIDCSGLICSVYSEIGVKVPRISWQQSEFGQEVGSIKDIKPGDWLFFVPEAGKEGYVSHAGIVTDVRNQDEIMFIHASTSRGVREDNLFSNYFKGRFVKAMRPF